MIRLWKEERLLMSAIADRMHLTRERVRQILKRWGGVSGYLPNEKKIAKQKRSRLRTALISLFRERWDRAEVLRLTEWEDSGSDLELCQRLNSELKIGTFFKYCRCSLCAKVFEMNSKGKICRPCNRERARARYASLTPEQRRIEWERLPSRKLRPLYSRRSALKHLGLDPDVYLPLPSKTPGAEKCAK